MKDWEIRAALRPHRKRITIGTAYTLTAEQLGIPRKVVCDTYLRGSNRWFIARFRRRAALIDTNARFIAEARQLVSELRAENERLRAALDDMLFWVDELSQQVEASDPAAFREDYNTAVALIDKEVGDGTA